MICEAAAPHVPTHAWESTVAIVIADKPYVRQFGSGILFECASQRYLVTAAHVINEAHKLGKTLGITSGGGPLTAVPEGWFVSDSSQSAEDPFDLAICTLPSHAIQKLQGRTYVNSSSTGNDTVSPTAVYAMFGYPGIWTVPSSTDLAPLKLKKFEFITSAYYGHTDGLKGYQPALHLLFTAEMKEIFSNDGFQAKFQDMNGNERQFPEKLGGVSGCSVWREIGPFPKKRGHGNQRDWLVWLQARILFKR
jgi:hypothetical protein